MEWNGIKGIKSRIGGYLDTTVYARWHKQGLEGRFNKQTAPDERNEEEEEEEEEKEGHDHLEIARPDIPSVR